MVDRLPTLEVSGVAVGYGGMAPVLTGVNLVVSPGELVGIVGPNGAGKTTLLESIAGLLHPSAGVILFHGQDVARLDPAGRRACGIGLVREGRRIFPSLTVEENLLVGHRKSTKGSSSKAEALDSAYALFPALYERRTLSGALLSGGEQQMLAIARSTMTPVDLLLVDEPFMGLSWLVAGQVAEALNAKRDEGMAVVVAEESERALLEMGVSIPIHLT